MSAPDVRFGYACINMHLNGDYCVNRTMRLATFNSKGEDAAIELAKGNLRSVRKVLRWNENHDLKFYRLSSDMFPHLGNPQCGAKIHHKVPIYSYDFSKFDRSLSKIGRYASRHGHRLTMHASQYNQVGAPNRDVFDKTIIDLGLHADILDSIGLGDDSVMIVHGGGVYGNKSKTIDRWMRQFKDLPSNVRNRLVLENCEKSYSTEDILGICEALDIPMVFDTHHYDCYNILHPDESQAKVKKLLPRIERTWTRRNIRWKMHVSEQDPDKKTGAHSKYVEHLPKTCIRYARKHDVSLDIMVEAKEKEHAAMHLRTKFEKKYSK